MLRRGIVAVKVSANKEDLNRRKSALYTNSSMI